MTKDEALKLALKFVEDSECGTADLETHIKEALAQHTWVGLTKNEVETLSYIAEGNTWIAVELAEAKLKEKNVSTL